VALLGNNSNIDCQQTADIAYEFGKNFGMAFQLIDDLLDVTSTDDDLGKPAIADLKLGLSTAPVLFASQQVRKRMTQCCDFERGDIVLCV
jgi:hexaprenyl-diphosphate synthase